MGDNNNYYNDDNANNNNNQGVYCRVYDRNDFFTLLVQLLLAAVALLSLYWKRFTETPRRTLRTWALDVSKQGIGACYAHVLNMMIASIISHNIRGDNVLNDQCAWYGMSYLIDTTLGLVLAILFLKLLDQVAHEQDWVHLKHSGVYTGPNGTWSWGVQVMAWLAILTLVKIIIYIFMWGFSSPLAWVGQVLFKPLQANIRLELVFVMIVFPGILNVIYFWIADGYLKAQKEHAGVHEEEEDEDHVETPYHSADAALA